MYLDVFSDNPFATNCWLLASEEANEAVVIDPGFFPDRVLALLRAAGKRPSAVLATHGHIDHIGAAAAVCGTELPFYIHKEDELALTDPEAWGAGFPVPTVRPNDVRAAAPPRKSLTPSRKLSQIVGSERSRLMMPPGPSHTSSFWRPRAGGPLDQSSSPGGSYPRSASRIQISRRMPRPTSPATRDETLGAQLGETGRL